MEGRKDGRINMINSRFTQLCERSLKKTDKQLHRELNFCCSDYVPVGQKMPTSRHIEIEDVSGSCDRASLM